MCIIPNFTAIGRTVLKTGKSLYLNRAICLFSKWRPSAILDLLSAYLEHARRVFGAFGGLCNCAKFGSNRCSSFDNMQFLIFCTLSLKMPIHTPKWGFGRSEDLTSKMESSFNVTPKWHTPIWWVDRYNPSTNAGVARSQE